MKEITFLERLAENLLEGGFIRALKPRLQPVQLAKALAKEMVRSQMIGPETPIVANSYHVFLSPADFPNFAGFQSNLERELAGYLRGFAVRKGFRPIAAVTVSIVESSGLKGGQIRTESRMLDISPPQQRPDADGQPRLDGTMEMPAVQLRETRETLHPAVARPQAALVGLGGELTPITREDTSVGRAIENDVVLEAKSVSRRHALIGWVGGRYLLEDLGSTNGTFVMGKRISRHQLSDGEEISFGGVRFIFRQSGS